MNDRTRNTCQLRNMHTVAFIGTSWHDLAQENDFATLFGDSHIQALNAWEHFRHLDQFMIVRGEERASAAAFIVVQVFDNSAGNGKPIIGAGPTPNLVEDNQT